MQHKRKRTRSTTSRVSGLVALAALIAACAGHAPKTHGPAVTATILGAGSVITEHTGERVTAPDTAEGSVGEVEAYWTPEFLAPPDQVRARVGTSIGIQVRIEGPEFLAMVPLRTRVTHPPIVDPKTGKRTRVDEWDNPMNARFPRFTGWRFDNPWELVPGKWTITLLHEGRVIARQEFRVKVATAARGNGETADDRPAEGQAVTPTQAGDGQATSASTEVSSPLLTYCDLVGSPREHLHRPVRVVGIFRVGFEWQQLYSTRCADGYTTWLDWGSGLQRCAGLPGPPELIAEDSSGSQDVSPEEKESIEL